MDDRIKKLLRPLVRRATDKRRVQEIETLVQVLVPNLNLSEKSLVIDLGANRGDFTLWASSKGATVIAFEPHRDAFRYLFRRTSGIDRVLPLQVAASEKTGITQFFHHPDSVKDPLGFSIRSSLIQKDLDFHPDPSKVLTVDFGELLKNFTYVDCIKIDIEGSESEIWSFLRENHSKIGFCMMEVHDDLNPGLREEIVEFISQQGLQARWTADWV